MMTNSLTGLSTPSWHARRRLAVAAFLGFVAAPVANDLLKEWSFFLSLSALLIITGLSVLFILGWIAALDIEEALFIPKRCDWNVILVAVLPFVFAPCMLSLLVELGVYTSAAQLAGIHFGILMGVGIGAYRCGVRLRF